MNKLHLPHRLSLQQSLVCMPLRVCVCVRARTHCHPDVWGHLHLQMGVSCQWGEGLPFYSPAVLESIGCIICSSWINILMENYKEDEYLETKGCRPRAENKKDCTSPRRWRPRNWLPIHLFYSCTHFIASVFSPSPWLLILNCLPVPSLCLPCPPPPCPSLLPGLPNDTVCAISNVADGEPRDASCLQPILGRADEEKGVSSSWKMIYSKRSPPDPLTAGPRLRRGTTKILQKVRLPTSAVNTQKGSGSEAQIDIKAWITDLRPRSPALNSESLLTKDRISIVTAQKVIPGSVVLCLLPNAYLGSLFIPSFKYPKHNSKYFQGTLLFHAP